VLGLGPNVFYVAGEFGNRDDGVAACTGRDRSFQARIAAPSAAPRVCGAALSYSHRTLALGDQRIPVLQLLKCCRHESHVPLQAHRLCEQLSPLRPLETLRLSCGLYATLKSRAIPFRQVSAYIVG
jgi:hypothetical protein